ncbi:MAG: heparan N-sulfatase, partial [Arenibacter sp.]|nr:heparan N-sulfatase [Arenibacter sp.]
RDHVLLGKERHDVGRSNQDGIDLAYPVRAIRNDSMLYVHNIIPERWPVGNPEYGFLNCDGSPTKSYLTNLQPGDEEYSFFQMNFDKRPEHELYNIKKDPHCINNLAEIPEHAAQIKTLRSQMETELIAQGDPRTLGKGEIFDKYIYYGKRLDYNTGKRISSLKYIKKLD